jgi:hypothetical protein
MNIIEVIELCAAEFPGWEWLIRSDGEKGAFANFNVPELRNSFGDWIDGETCFPVWADTPENALFGSLQWARQVHGRKPS